MRGVYGGLLGCVLFVFAGCSDARPDASDPEDASHARSVIDDAVADGFSGAILIRNEGEVVISEAHGLADRDRATPNTPDTAFDVGSILKTLTTAGIFRLVEDGALTLDTTLTELFPEVPPDKADITVQNIVQHRAGFAEYHDTMGDFEAMTRLEARARILSQDLLFAPDTDEAYSNSGYTLLADVLETVTGEPYVDFVRRSLLEPAGMRSSGFYSEPVWSDVATAIGYDAATFRANDPADWPYTWALVGNGGLVTTVGDLDRFLTALFGGVFMEPETFDVMREVYLSAGEATVEGQRVYGEAGAGDFGFGGVAVFAPDAGMRVLITTNTYDAFDIEALATDLALGFLEAD